MSKDRFTLIAFHHPLGGIRALSTLTQMFYKHSEPDAGVYTPYAPLVVEDVPVFASQRSQPRYCTKHHPTERSSVNNRSSSVLPLETPALPVLASKGTYRQDKIWSAADLHEVQQFGSYRGVEVHLEVDMPGHTASIYAAYPDLI